MEARALDLKQLVLVRRSRNRHLRYSQNRHCKTGSRGCGRYQRATRSLQKEGRAPRRMYRRRIHANRAQQLSRRDQQQLFQTWSQTSKVGTEIEWTAMRLEDIPRMETH